MWKQKGAILHPARGPGAAGHLVKLGKLLKQNSAQAVQFRTGLLALMGDPSQYMKLNITCPSRLLRGKEVWPAAMAGLALCVHRAFG